MTPRLVAVLVLVVLIVAAGLTALVMVPWRSVPAPRADQLDALRELPADQVSRGRAFHAELRPATYASLAIGLVIALVLGLTSLGAKVVMLFGGNWAARAALGGLAVLLISSVLTLPFSVWRRTILRRYGLSTQGWGGWAVDLLKGYAVSAVLGGLALLAFYAVARYVPDWWWAASAAGAAGLAVLLSFVFPVIFEPIFNKFTPMAEGPLRTELLTLAADDRVPVRDVLVADASRRTRAVNAYVSGFGATRRIVVYDTLIDRAEPAEVRSVVAHELGHAKLRDVVTGTVLGALGAAAAVVAVYLLGFWHGLLSLAGVASIAEPRSVALLLAVAALAGLVTGPAQSLVSRKVEARADAHALALTRDPDTFVATHARLSAINLSDPDPNRIEHLLFASHPSTVQRIAAAKAYARGAQ
ncbi:M48 family metallopeptidase [Rugosimonospora acidiphila]|uniref:M48 family metallopeptidase n=1 Tax=Rugosimonospora acidiphila TaxID=556531 RepID=A0ABP9RQP1_9ACTN